MTEALNPVRRRSRDGSRLVFFALLQLLAVAAVLAMAVIVLRLETDPLGVLGLFVITGLYFAGLFAAFFAFAISKPNLPRQLRKWAAGFLAVYAIPFPIVAGVMVLFATVW